MANPLEIFILYWFLQVFGWKKDLAVNQLLETSITSLGNSLILRSIYRKIGTQTPLGKFVNTPVWIKNGIAQSSYRDTLFYQRISKGCNRDFQGLVYNKVFFPAKYLWKSAQNRIFQRLWQHFPGGKVMFSFLFKISNGWCWKSLSIPLYG